MQSTLLSLLSEVSDPRRGQGKMYSLPPILLFTVLAMLAGAVSYRQVHGKRRLIGTVDVVRCRRRRSCGRDLSGAAVVEIDTGKIDDAVLALLHLTLHDKIRAWKGHDWDVLDRLYRKGMIYDPVGKAKSVVLTDEGLAASERLFRELFGKPGT